MKTQYIIPCSRTVGSYGSPEPAHLGVINPDSGGVAIQQIKGGNVSVAYRLTFDDARDLVNALLEALKEDNDQ